MRTAAITGRVVSANDQKPIPGVQIWTGALNLGGDTQTDADGRFSIDITYITPEKPAARFSRPGYSPLTKVFEENATESVVALPGLSVDSFRVSSCRENAEFGGSLMAFSLPKGTKIRRGSDIDYATQHIVYQKNALRYGSGPNWSYGLPPALSSYIVNSVEVTERDIVFSDDVIGAEYRGRSRNGTYFRWIGRFGETVEYDGATKQEATFFDAILDTLCNAGRR